MTLDGTELSAPGRLELIGLQKRFGAVVAVDDVNLTVNDGELLAVVGPSGSGKTTLLRIIAGLERPDRGRIVIQGNDMTGTPPERRDVGFVFQQFALFPNMNVAANIEYGLKRRRMPRAERMRRVQEMLAMVGLQGLAHRRPDQLSAGQQQRVALARALAPRPKTLLLDEPLSALDAAIRGRLREELRQTQRRLGITTILVTHDQEEALAIADRVAVMNEARLEQVGTPWELYDQPRTMFVAGFVGRGNFIAARVDDAHIAFEGFGRLPKDVLADVDGLPHGPVTALVRPESVLIGTGDGRQALSRDGMVGGTVGTIHRAASAGGAELRRDGREGLTVAATIVDVTFGGERSMVKLAMTDTEAGDPPKHQLLAAVVSGQAHRLARRIGERVTVSIPSDAIRLLPPN